MLHFTLAVTVDTAGWKLDSGATQHIVNVTSYFTSFVSYGTPKVLQVGKAAVYLRAVGEGTVVLKIPPKPAEAGRLRNSRRFLRAHPDQSVALSRVPLSTHQHPQNCGEGQHHQAGQQGSYHPTAGRHPRHLDALGKDRPLYLQTHGAYPGDCTSSGE